MSPSYSRFVQGAIETASARTASGTLNDTIKGNEPRASDVLASPVRVKNAENLLDSSNSNKGTGVAVADSVALVRDGVSAVSTLSAVAPPLMRGAVMEAAVVFAPETGGASLAAVVLSSAAIAAAGYGYDQLPEATRQSIEQPVKDAVNFVRTAEGGRARYAKEAAERKRAAYTTRPAP